MLDAEEYFHLALHANSAGQIHACIWYLKEVLQLQPRHAGAIYLLAVQHAEVGLSARAVAGMQAALAIDPSIEIARLQLALLLLDSGLPEQAKQQLALLYEARDESLRSYARALTALVEDDHVRAQEYLTRGLAQTTANSALSDSMRRLLDRLSKEGAGRVAPEPSQAEVFLGAYRQAKA